MTLGYRVEDVQAAEKVYREAREEIWRIQRLPANEHKISQFLAARLAGDMEVAIESNFALERDEGIRVISGVGKLLKMTPIEPEENLEESTIILDVCLDEREITAQRKDGRVAHGSEIHDEALISRIDGSFRWIGNKSIKGGAPCSGSQ